MSAGPENPVPPGKTGLRAAWLGSRRVAVMAGVIGVGVLTGAGVAVAATGSSSPSPAPSAPASAPAKPPPAPKGAPKNLPWRIAHRGGPLPFAPPFAGPGPLGAGLLGAVHGTVVVPRSGGGYQTVAFQNGNVTAVSGASITVHSADGYSHTYRVTGSTMVDAQRDGIGSIKDGNQVTVAATVSGSTATATRIIDLTLLQKSVHGFFGAPAGAKLKMAVPIP